MASLQSLHRGMVVSYGTSSCGKLIEQLGSFVKGRLGMRPNVEPHACPYCAYIVVGVVQGGFAAHSDLWWHVQDKHQGQSSILYNCSKTCAHITVMPAVDFSEDV